MMPLPVEIFGYATATILYGPTDTHVFLFIGPARVKCESVTAGSLFDWRFFDHITLNSHRLEPFEPPAESIYDVDKSFLQDGRNRLVLNLHNVLCEHKHVRIVVYTLNRQHR